MSQNVPNSKGNLNSKESTILSTLVLATVPGWNRPEGPSPGQEPPSNPNRSGLTGLLPGLDINPRFLAGLNPHLGFIFAIPATVAPIKYLSSDRITI
jgi:hypothetical protein